jgi:hypothetical protein
LVSPIIMSSSVPAASCGPSGEAGDIGLAGGIMLFCRGCEVLVGTSALTLEVVVAACVDAVVESASGLAPEAVKAGVVFRPSVA